MPTYCYTGINSGETMEHDFPMGQAPPKIHWCDDLYERDYGAEVRGMVVSVKRGSGHVRRKWPLECIGSGVNAVQAPELRDHFKKNGLAVEVSDDGNPIYESAAQRKKALKCRGLVDKSAYY